MQWVSDVYAGATTKSDDWQMKSLAWVVGVL